MVETGPSLHHMVTIDKEALLPLTTHKRKYVCNLQSMTQTVYNRFYSMCQNSDSIKYLKNVKIYVIITSH